MQRQNCTLLNGSLHWRKLRSSSGISCCCDNMRKTHNVPPREGVRQERYTCVRSVFWILSSGRRSRKTQGQGDSIALTCANNPLEEHSARVQLFRARSSRREQFHRCVRFQPSCAPPPSHQLRLHVIFTALVARRHFWFWHIKTLCSICPGIGQAMCARFVDDVCVVSSTGFHLGVRKKDKIRHDIFCLVVPSAN